MALKPKTKAYLIAAILFYNPENIYLTNVKYFSEIHKHQHPQIQTPTVISSPPHKIARRHVLASEETGFRCSPTV
jgi:hypothetical protein